MGIENKRAVILAVVAGHLLVVAGAIGSAGIWGTLITILAPLVPVYVAGMLNVLFVIVNLIALYGGVAVIDGALLLAGDYKLPGKIVIGIGSGVGLLGFIFDHIVAIYSGTFTIQGWVLLLQTPGYIGVILAIIACIQAKGL